MSASILKYGQVIRICSNQASMANPTISNTFITSKSYTDQNLYFQVYDADDKYLHQTPNQTLNIPNYRQSLFQILPTSSFEINDQMNAIKNPAKKKQAAPRAKTQQEQFKAIISQKRGKYISFGDRVVFKHLDSQYYMYGSFDCATSGIGAFKIKLRKELSQKIIFQVKSYRTYEKEGDQISINAPFRIYHCETQCYVSYCFQKLFIDKKFDTLDRFRSDFLDHFVEYPQIKASYHINDKDNQRGYGQEQNEEITSKAVVTFPNAGRFEIINENIPKRVFKLVLHNQFQMKPNKQNIKNHDIVYFIHTKDDKYLCCSNFKRGRKSDIFLKMRKNQTDTNHIFDGLWQIQEVKTIEDKGDKHQDQLGKSRTPNAKKTNLGPSMMFSNNLSLPKNDHAYLAQTVTNLQTGALGVGIVDQQQKTTKSKKKFVVRHLISGRIMFINENQIVKVENSQKRRNQKPILLESVDSNLVDGALVQFAHKATIDRKIVKYYLDIQDGEGQKVKQYYNNIAIEQALGQQQYMEEGNSQILQQQDMPNQIQATYSSFFEIDELQMTTDSSQHGFRIFKVDQQIKQLALFVLSSQQIIYKFCGSLARLKYLNQNSQNANKQLLLELAQDISVPVLNNVINVLKDLTGFIYDCEYSIIAESGNSPNSKKQRIFDQLGMIQLLTRLVQIIDTYDEPLQRVVDKSQSQYKKVRSIYVLAYEVLQSIAANNYLQKIKISKFLQTYLQQIKKAPNKVVYRSIQQVLDGNYLALETLQNKNNTGYIKSLIDNFDIKNPDPADLYFLSRLCLCKQKTINNNQNAVYESFYKTNQQKRSGFAQQKIADNKFKFRQDQGKMQILSKISYFPPQYRTLTQLYEQCEMSSAEGVVDPQKGHWNYFLQYLNLLADICVQRNTTPLQYILDNLPLKTLVAFLHESTVKKKLLFQPFIRLVHHAFVQNRKFEEINRITKVKQWNNLGNFNIPKSTKQIEPDLIKTMNLIMDYIRRINKLDFALTDGKQKKQNANPLEKQDHEPESIDFNPQDKARIINVKTFLQILKSTLNLGFWPSMQNMKKMVPYMLKVMKFDIQYAKKKLILKKQEDKKKGENQHLSDKQYRQMVYALIKQQLTLNKPNIVLLVECKILAAQILNIIIDYEYNVRVSIITKYFKDVMENDVDLSKYKFDKVQFIKKWKDNKQYELIEPLNQKQGYLLNQELWKDKVNQIIEERNVFQLCTQECIDKSLIMFQTFVYQNQQLTNMTFQILNRITNERREILKTFKDIIFVAGGNLSKLADRGVRVTRSVLLHLQNNRIKSQTITSTPNRLWQVVRADGRDLILNDSRPLGAIQQLAFLTMAMMKNGNPTLQRASKFYKDHQLYPYKQLIPSKKDDVDFQEDGSYLVITQKDQNLPLNQNLIKSQDHHLIIIDFIKIMSDIKQDQDEVRPLPRRALHAAYNFLTVLVWNHNQNKKQLEDLLRISECHLKFNLGTIDFYKQMYKNNKKLVKKSDINRIVHHIIDLANNTDIRLYQKSKLLDFLRIIVIFDDQGYDVNQNMVMEIISQYQVSSDNQIVILNIQKDPLSQRILKNIEHWMLNYADSYYRSTRSYSDLEVSPQLFYIATFFEIFSALIENKNEVNIGKCTNMHPIKFLLSYLENSNNCWPLIRHLRAYVNKLYYFDGREKDTSLFEAFIEKDLPNIRNQLRGIVELVCNTPDYNIIRIKNPIRYAYLGSYVFLSLEQILHSLDLMFSTKQFNSHMLMLMSQITADDPGVAILLLQIIQMDQYLQKTIDGRYINQYLAKVSTHLKKIVANVHISIVDKFNELSKKQMNDNMKDGTFGGDDVPFKKNYTFHQQKGLWRHLIDWNSFKQQDTKRAKLLDSIQKGIVKDPAQSKEAQLQKKRDYMLDYIYLGNIQKKIQKVKAEKPVNINQQVQQVKNQQQILAQTNLPKNLTTSMSNRFKVKNERFQNTQIKNTIINTRRKKLVKFIQINQEFQKFSLQQTEVKLYNIFANLNIISKDKYESVVVGSADVIKAIVKMNQADPNFIKPDYKLMVVKLLTNYIQRESKVFQQNIQDWYIKQKEEVQAVKNAQNFLNQCGCAKFLCSLIINDLRTDIKMGNSILMFGISLLLGQNKDNQQAIFKILKQDQKNILIAQLQNLIKSCGTSIANIASSNQIKEYSSQINYSDTYDFYNDSDKSMSRKFVFVPETVQQQKQFSLKLISLQETFIFLRVLCEGNNEIKNFIRQQTTNDEDKKVKSQSINFIALGVFEIKRMFTKFDINIVKVPFSIIDFIIQVTQIPCIQNQLFLCQSSFFHDFAALESEIDIALKQGRISQEIHNIKIINKLYSLSIKNIISCLQGNMEEIYNHLSSQDLCLFFTKCFRFYVQYLPLLQNIQGYKIQSCQDLQKLLSKNKLHGNYFLDIFQVTSVVIKLKHKTPIQGFQKRIEFNLNKSKMKESFQLIVKNLLGIQITMDEYQLSSDFNQILFFPKHNVFNYLSRSTRSRIMDQINRSTQRDKIIGLFNTTHQISEEIDYNYYLDNQYKFNDQIPVSISNTKIAFYQNLSMYIATFICFLMILFSTVIYYPYEHVIQYDMGPQTTLLNILSYIQFIVALIFYLLWIKNHLHLAQGKYNEELGALAEQGITQSSFIKLFFKIPFAKNLYCLFRFDQQFFSVILFMFGSIMGCFWNVSWFSLLIFNLMMQKMDVLKNILMAITTNLKMLGMLSLLGISFISIFSIFSIHYYASSLYPQRLPKQHCTSLTNCIIELYIQQQIGEDMDSFQTGRFISDMIYTIFMDMLFGNIVGGVLIDTFAQLRQRGDQIQQDKKGKCFICGIQKQTLQKRNQDLKTHYKYQYHKLWNYVFYLYYLNTQNKKTGLQIIIQEKIKAQNVSWIPSASSDTGDIGQKIEQLSKLIQQQKDAIKSLDSPQ